MSIQEAKLEMGALRTRIAQIDVDIRTVRRSYHQDGMSGCCFEREEIAKLREERDHCISKLRTIAVMMA